MRHLLLVSLLLAGVGCQGLHDRRHCRSDCVATEPCAEKKVTTPAPKTPEKVTTPLTESAPQAAVAQEVLLVPRMVYVPFVAQTPTAPVRLGPNMTVAQPQQPVGVPRPEEKPRVEEKPCPPETLKKAMETCEKLQERINHLEKCLKERAAPAPVCPTPFFRRPLFNRCEPLFKRCEPKCETLVPCDAASMPAVTTMMPSQPSESPPSPVRGSRTGDEVVPLQQIPRRAPMVNID